MKIFWPKKQKHLMFFFKNESGSTGIFYFIYLFLCVCVIFAFCRFIIMSNWLYYHDIFVGFKLAFMKLKHKNIPNFTQHENNLL